MQREQHPLSFFDAALSVGNASTIRNEEQEVELDKKDQTEAGPTIIEISLLKTIRMHLFLPHLQKRYPLDAEALSVKAQCLIAYLAWHQMELVSLSDIRTHVFADIQAKQRHDAFCVAKRDIRRCLRSAIADANNDLGKQAIPHDLDLFALAKNRRYSLAACCQVTDLSFLEQQQRAIKNACDAIVATYAGNFIEDQLAGEPPSWAQKPLAHYQKLYLLALTYVGAYEREKGERTTEATQRYVRYASAGDLFVRGAMAVVCGKYSGVSLSSSEQLLRQAMECYREIGATYQALSAYEAYEQQVLLVSAGTWTPHPETTKMMTTLLKQENKTHLYPFPSEHHW